MASENEGYVSRRRRVPNPGAYAVTVGRELRCTLANRPSRLRARCIAPRQESRPWEPVGKLSASVPRY